MLYKETVRDINIPFGGRRKEVGGGIKLKRTDLRYIIRKKDKLYAMH